MANYSQPYPITLTDKSGTITVGGTAQILVAQSSRRYLLIQNISSNDLWINFGVTAVADSPSLRIAPGETFVMEGSSISHQSISVIGATTGQKWVAKEG